MPRLHTNLDWISVTMITMVKLFTLIFCCCTLVHHVSGLQATVYVQTDRRMIELDYRYYSLGIDVNLIRHGWITMNFTSNRLKTMATALSPAYLRLSGTDADSMYFDKNGKTRKTKSQYELDQAIKEYKKTGRLFPGTRFNMTGEDWDNINTFCKDVGWRLMFGFNLQTRNRSEWDLDYAREILDYSIEKGYHNNLDFQLGNEPDLYRNTSTQVKLTMQQVGRDFLSLRNLLNSKKYKEYYKEPTIAGPDIANSMDTTAVTEFLNVAGGAVNAMTWHYYYGSSEHIHYPENYTDPSILDSYIPHVKAMAEGIKNSNYPYIKSWQGETSSTTHPPGSDIDMSFVAGFMLLDKLGLNAAMGVDLFVRQTFYGFWFSMIDQSLQPTPDFWISYIYKNLVGSDVYEVFVLMENEYKVQRRARFYAHNTNPNYGYPGGSITVYGMNLFNETLNVTFETDGIENLSIDVFILTPGGWGGITSRFISLNGDILVMPDDFNFPMLKPRLIRQGESVEMPSLSMGFFVFTNVNMS